MPIASSLPGIGRAQNTIQPAQLGETKVVKKYDNWLFASQPSEKDLAAAKAAGVEAVAFDRSGFKYHGRVKALADAAREAGLKF